MIDKTISWNDYTKIQRMNPSTLVHGCKSMLRLKRAISEGFPEATPCMEFGTNLHTLTLEPKKFRERYVIMPAFHRDAENVTSDGKPSKMTTTNYCKAKIAAFEDESRSLGKKVIEQADYERILKCVEALHAKPHIKELFDTNSSEVTITGEICGVECKGRVDLLLPYEVVDLKGTDDLQFFGKIFNGLGYPFKLAMYWDLVRQNSSERNVKIIAQEVKDDFDNMLVTVPTWFLKLSLERVCDVMERYKKCLENDVWCGVDGGAKEVECSIPFWAEKHRPDLLQWGDIAFGETIEELF